MAGTGAVLKQFSLEGQVAFITGGTGVLGSCMAKGLADAGAKVAIMGRRAEVAEALAKEITEAGGTAMAAPGDVLSIESIEAARDAVVAAWGRVDILVNAAGGNQAKATVGPDAQFWDCTPEALLKVQELNLMGTMLPCQVFCKLMTEQEGKVGTVVNISSMAAQLPLTRVVGYSASKAGIDSFTKWLAVEMAEKHGPGMRVNALAPGFFLADQNRALLTNEDGSLTSRGNKICLNTPMRRFGDAEELIGALLFLSSQASKFMTGSIVSVDGGFGCFGGV